MQKAESTKCIIHAFKKKTPDSGEKISISGELNSCVKNKKVLFSMTTATWTPGREGEQPSGTNSWLIWHSAPFHYSARSRP